MSYKLQIQQQTITTRTTNTNTNYINYETANKTKKLTGFIKGKITATKIKEIQYLNKKLYLKNKPEHLINVLI